MVMQVDRSTVHRPLGFRFGAVASGMKADGQLDLAWCEAPSGSAAAGRFSRQSTAPAVSCSRQHLQAVHGQARGVLVHAGVANVGTGQDGEQAVRQLLQSLSSAAELRTEELLLCGTGRMGVQLPLLRLRSHLVPLLESADASRADDFARAILTTDQTTKCASASGVADGHVTKVLGIAKGSSGIDPHLATMLVFLFTDACLSPTTLQELLAATSPANLESIAIDGTSSPADSILALASCKNGGPPLQPGGLGYRVLQAGFAAVQQDLARQILQDGDPQSRIVQVTVSSALDNSTADRVARLIQSDLDLKRSIGQSKQCDQEILQLLQLSAPSIATDQLRLNCIYRGSKAAIRIDLGQPGKGRSTRWFRAEPPEERPQFSRT
jgi:glutamate N-acetyltransferase/amino-acid N-acetyltransferase